MYSIERANEVLVNGDGIIAVSLVSGLMSADEPYIMFKRLSKIAVVIIVRTGWADVEVDHEVHHVDAENDNLIMLGNFSIIGGVVCSGDMSADIVILSKKFLSRIVPESSVNGRPSVVFPVTNVIAMRDNPVMHLESEEKELLHGFFQRVLYNSKRTEAILRVHLLYVSTLEFLMELMNIILPRYLEHKPTKALTDRNQYIVEQFSRLVFDNYKQEHSVSYYSDRMCISAQYLSKATRAVLGVSASKIISDMIVTEALIMLRNPAFSMQQIASELGFSDQSSFGKFFKKIHGISPLAYRKQL